MSDSFDNFYIIDCFDSVNFDTSVSTTVPILNVWQLSKLLPLQTFCKVLPYFKKSSIIYNICFRIPQDAADEKKKENYEPRIKRHDGRLSALKKGNYLVQANVDRLQDEINKMREKSVTLQADLDSVLSELG